MERTDFSCIFRVCEDEGLILYELMYLCSQSSRIIYNSGFLSIACIHYTAWFTTLYGDMIVECISIKIALYLKLVVLFRVLLNGVVVNICRFQSLRKF